LALSLTPAARLLAIDGAGVSDGLHGVAVYNPDLLAKHELVSLFVARRPLLERLIRDLHDEIGGVAQHHLIVGRRGMGKTTLLRRLRYAVEDDPELDARWVPLVFPEEQYNVASLSDFWLNCVDALADALESRGRREALAAIDEQVTTISAMIDEAERRASALSLLLSLADRIARRMVLLVDNLDLVFARFTQEDWALRETLSRERRLLLIGATSQALESSFRYEQAFYDFFRIHELDGLDEVQSFEVMRHLAEITKQPRVLEVIEHDPGRIQTLRLLSGGNPRTLVLLFNLLSQGTEGDARSDLERLLDQITPLYKHRFEELPAQAQRVVDGLALGWDPMTARDLADRLRLDINHTSAQLNRLVKQGVVEKTRLPGSARTGFQLSERFFNIWYLMRASRRMRRRLMFLVRFLELFFQKPALRAQAQRRLRAMESPRDADYGFALAQVTDDVGLRHALETHSLRAALADPRTALGAILDLDGEDHALGSRAERIGALMEAERLVLAKQDWPDGLDGAGFWERLGGVVSISAQEKLKIAASLSQVSALWLTFLCQRCDDERHQLAARSSEAVAAVVYTAARQGYIDSDLGADDIESVVAFVESPDVRPFLLALKSLQGRLGERGMFDSCIHETRSHWVRTRWATWASHIDVDTRLDTIRAAEPSTICTESLLDFANLLRVFSRFEECEFAVRQATERDPNSAHAWYGLAFLLKNHLSRYEEAEAAYRRAIEIDSNHAHAWNGLANLLQDQFSLYEEAEAAYRRAIEIDSNYAHAWNGLANLLQNHLSRYAEAEAAYRRAIEIDPNFPYWHGLADLLQNHFSRYEEAEAAYRRAIEIDSNFPYPWYGLANLLQYRLSRYEEAEAAYRRAIEIDSNFAYCWYELANLLQNRLSRYNDAEFAFQCATALAPNDAEIFNSYAWLVYTNDHDLESAERAAQRAVELVPSSPYFTHTLACIQAARGQWSSELARRFLTDEKSYREFWGDTMVFFAEVVRHGHTGAARVLVQSLPNFEAWTPLITALEVLERDSAEPLRALSPEMRAAVELALSRIAPGLASTSSS
jgi:tetratricopeptide (TPR) repeat protein